MSHIKDFVFTCLSLHRKTIEEQVNLQLFFLKQQSSTYNIFLSAKVYNLKQAIVSYMGHP